MVDFSFFRSRSFLGANLVAFIVSFAMLAMFFFLALYMQNILGYSPLQAGVRFLPSTLIIIVSAPIAGRLTDRVGPRVLMGAGLAAVAGSLWWQSGINVHTGYGRLLPAFMLMGLGMGFTMSPMSTAAMNAVHQTKAGVASGILSMSRMVGGTFGVAVMGALITALGRNKLDDLLPGLPAGQRQSLAEGLGSGGASAATGRVAAAMREAFVSSLGSGLRIAAVVAFVGAVVSVTLIARGPERRPEQEAAPDTALAEQLAA
jgi:MFS family permease